MVNFDHKDQEVAFYAFCIQAGSVIIAYGN